MSKTVSTSYGKCFSRESMDFRFPAACRVEMWMRWLELRRLNWTMRWEPRVKKAKQDRQCLGPHNSRLYLHEKVIISVLLRLLLFWILNHLQPKFIPTGLQLLILLNKRGSVILATAQGSRIHFDSLNRFPRAVISSSRVPTVLSVVENPK